MMVLKVCDSGYSKSLDWNMSSFLEWIKYSIDADKGSDPGDTANDKDKCDAFTPDANLFSVEEVSFEGITKELESMLFYYFAFKIIVDALPRNRLTSKLNLRLNVFLTRLDVMV
jgi:hypothetical protein